MEIFKIVGLGIITCLASILIKQVKPELNILVIISGCCLILISIMPKVVSLINNFTGITKLLNIDNALLHSVVKIIGIGYVVEFGVSVCNDSGHSAVAEKLLLAGKITILLMCLPIINKLIEIIVEIVP